jgi:DNA-binding NtrC family response regulator
MSISSELSSSSTKITYEGGRPTAITLRRLQLLVIHPDGKRENRTFDQDVVTIGAVEDNDLVLPDETVSRNHARIWLDGDSYIVTDLGSTNGSFINRVRIREAFLKPDQVINIGETEIRFVPVAEKVKIVPSDKQRFGDLVGRSDRIREIYSILERIAPTDASIIIGGETGTGKEVVARTVHQQSRRREGPFIVFDCGAIPENLIESELFGHEKGSFTGATNTRQGVFEMANGGTVFLDELGELAIDLQPKLLRVLEQREVRRVGGSGTRKVDVRIVAATNRDLEKEVRAGRFREDLFYRLNVVRVQLPSLRERKEDIPLLVQHFLQSGNFNKTREGERKVRNVSRDAMDRILAHAWPGNVRELHNVVERAVSFADTDTIETQDLPDHVGFTRSSDPDVGLQIAQLAPSAQAPVAAGSTATVPEGTFKDAKEKWVSSFERDYIAHLLQKNGNNISHAAREAEIDRKYFRKLMKKYGLHDPNGGGSVELEEDDGADE